MTKQEARNLAEKDIQEGKSWRVFDHPESEPQKVYDLERMFFEMWNNLEECYE